MNKSSMFWQLTHTYIKRFSKYYFAIALSTFFIFVFCALISSYLSDNVYKEKIFQKYSIAYYIPEGADDNYNQLAVSMLKELGGMKETANLIPVSSAEEGYYMLDNNEVLYLIIVPDDFLRGIMYGYNYPLEIIVKEHDSIACYIANELFLSYANYLKIAQAAAYSGYDTAVSDNISDSDLEALQNNIDITFLDRCLNKDSHISKIVATNEGAFSLLEHYYSVAVILTIVFMSFILIPCIQNVSPGVYTLLNTYKINRFHIIFANSIAATPAFFISYLLSNLVLAFMPANDTFNFNYAGLLSIIPVLFIISFCISSVAIFCKNQTIASLVIFGVIIIGLYIGGGFIPDILLPEIIRKLSDLTPFKLLIRFFEYSLFEV